MNEPLQTDIFGQPKSDDAEKLKLNSYPFFKKPLNLHLYPSQNILLSFEPKPEHNILMWVPSPSLYMMITESN